MSGSTTGNNTIGSGSDSITLNMAEDQALGVDAEFTVNVDGKQIGGVQTVTASQASGQTQAFTFAGNWAPGSHDVTVTFANNFIYPGLSGDRNLYVDGVSYDGQSVSSGRTAIYNSPLFPPNSTVGNVDGNAVFKINDTTSVPSNAASTPTTTPGPVSVGSGADTLVLKMAEDAYQGDAQFTVSVDGKQVGGTQTTSAIVGQGQAQEFDVHGNFGSGSHDVSVNFLNDKIGAFYPGTQWAVDTTDRNLYVMGASLNGGAPASGTPWELSSSGSKDFTVTAGSGSTATSDNATVSTGSLTTASSEGMNFIPGSTGGSSTDGASSGTSIISAAMPPATTTTQDFSVPSATTASVDHSGSGGSNWLMAHQHATNAGSMIAHHS